jgi:uncharacterized iron-regulated protein
MLFYNTFSEERMKVFMALMLLLLLGMLPKNISADIPHRWDGKIVDLRAGEDISLPELALRLSRAHIVVLGESHYNPVLHLREGDTIYWTVKKAGVICNFTVAWEFLNIAEQERTRTAFRDLLVGSIDATAFMKMVHGSKAAAVYAPIAEAAKLLMGYFVGVNVPDEERRAVKKGGIVAATPAMVPPDFRLVSAAYLERFQGAMKEHGVKPEKVPNYFLAQCLSDDAMAYNLLNETATPLKFLVAGGFHSDYGQGVVARLRARAPKKTVMTVRFLDLSGLTEEEIPGLLRDPRYGPVADFVYFIGEPQQNNAADNTATSAPAP